MKERILIVLHDAGGAAAVAPVIPQLQEHYDCRVFAFETAAKELQNSSFERHDNFTPEDAARFLETYHPVLVLTGTSEPGDTIDRAFINAAGKKGIPSLAVLDYWADYRQRFNGVNGAELGCLPDKIAVMDEDAKEEMIAKGIPAELIVVTGSPRFEMLGTQSAEGSAHRKAIAQQYNLDTNKLWVLFLSQPFASYYGGEEAAREAIGYTEKDAIDCLVQAIGKKDFQVIARLHPREDSSNRSLFESVPAVFIQDIEIEKLIAAVDLVTGMGTVALIDAWLMKKPVISIQPRQKDPDLCYLTRRGLAPKCGSPEEVGKYLALTVKHKNFIDFDSAGLFRANASANLLALIKSMIA